MQREELGDSPGDYTHYRRLINEAVDVLHRDLEHTFSGCVPEARDFILAKEFIQESLGKFRDRLSEVIPPNTGNPKTESSYTPKPRYKSGDGPLTFGEAIEAIKDDYTVYDESWNGLDMHLTLVDFATNYHGSPLAKHICRREWDENRWTCTPWFPRTRDYMSDNWWIF